MTKPLRILSGPSDKHWAASGVLRETEKKSIRLRFTASKQAMLCHSLGAQVRMVWPTTNAGYPLVPSTTQVDEETAYCLEETS